MKIKGAIMRSPVKIILVLALIACAAIGLRHVQGQSDHQLNQGRVSALAASNRPLEDSTVQAQGGAFVLKNMTLIKMKGSTILKGKVVNKTNRKYEQVFFEVRAYDRDGQILKGLENKTIFASQELKAGASTTINHGYGVWLQGVPAEKIARIEIVENGKEMVSSTLARMIPLASHALDLKRYAEIEE
jgi:hypothetical protein